MVFSLSFPVSPLFPSGFAELLFVLVFMLWFYFELINQAFVAIKNKDSIIVIKNDRLSLLAIYLSTFVGLNIAGYFGVLRVNYGFAALPFWTFYVGIALMVSGELFREWCIYILGKFFTFPVIITKDHKLVKKGPYKLIRHPGYLGGLIAFIGIGLAMQSWAALVLAGIPVLVAYAYRIHVEEKALVRHFGNEYTEYRRSTHAIIPYVL